MPHFLPSLDLTVSAISSLRCLARSKNLLPSGHVEYAYRDMARKGRKREHVILIEEAHRLLAGGEGAEGKSAEDEWDSTVWPMS